MQLKHFTLTALASVASAQNLTEALAGNQDLSALAGLVGQLPEDVRTLLGTASNITILAPSNSAIEAALATPIGAQLANNTALLTALLEYHIINGSFPATSIPESLTFVPTLLENEQYELITGPQNVGVLRQGEDVTIFSGAGANSSVTTANVNFTGGVIHIIDTVLTVPIAITDTAVAANLSAVAGAINTLNLTDTINTTPDLTVFAPSNAAFEAISNALSNFTTEQLSDVLQYHVVSGTVGYSSLLQDDQRIPALKGGDLTINIDNGAVFVNNARVILPNVLVKNGVVHVIDNVLSPNATQTSQGPVVPSATGTDVPFTTQAPTPSSSDGGAGGASESGGGTSTGGAVMPTGAVGVAALFGAAAIGAMNY